MATMVVGDNMRLTPAAIAPLDWPDRMPSCARWEATREEEQAVSVDMHGPPRLKLYAILFIAHI